MKLFRLATAAAMTVATIWACGGDDSTTPGGDAGSDATAGDGGGGGDSATTDSGPTVPPPSSLTFLDFDPSDGGVDGYIHIGHAADDSKLTGYSIFYGKSATEKLQNTRITTVPKAVPETAGFPLSVNPIPAGATFLLAYSESAGGESAPVAVKLDRTPAFVDLGSDAGMFYAPSIAIDGVNRKLLMGYTAGDAYPHVVRCELDGTACTEHIVGFGGDTSLSSPSLAVDANGAALLVVWKGPSGLLMAHCALDATACVDIDISVGKPAGAAAWPSVYVDNVEKKILVAVSDTTNASRPALYICDLAIGADGGAAFEADGGAACKFIDISAGAPASSALGVSNLVLEAVSGKLIVATDDGSKNDTTSIFRCNVDGTSCTYSNIDGDAGTDINEFPSLIYDPSDDSVFITSFDNTATNQRLVHCNPTFTTCSPIDLASLSSSVGSSALPTSALDDSNDKIFTIMTDGAFALRLTRCNRDGGACAVYDMGAGQPVRSGFNPAVVADPTSSLFVVTRNQSTASTKPSLFLLR